MFAVNWERLSPERAQELREQSKTALSILIAFIAFSSSDALQAVALGLLLYTIGLYGLTCIGYFQGTSFVTCACLHTVPFVGILVMVIMKLVVVVRSPGVVIMVLVFCILLLFVGGVQHIWWIQDEPSAAHVEGCGRTSCEGNTGV
ncbi:hypothetical protein EDC04DRAFT_2763743 [Pisolithus marmoratus]|nr:hypothetical protein EDC04DRAFT_2763743 [Pisolithus marmoratus]